MKMLLCGLNNQLNNDILIYAFKQEHNVIYYTQINDSCDLNNVKIVTCLDNVIDQTIDVVIYTGHIETCCNLKKKIKSYLNLDKILEFLKNKHVKKFVVFSRYSNDETNISSSIDLKTMYNKQEQEVINHCELYNISGIILRIADVKKTTNISSYTEYVIKMFDKYIHPHFKIDKNIEYALKHTNNSIIEDIMFLIKYFNSKCSVFEVAYKNSDFVESFINQFSKKNQFTIEYCDSEFEISVNEEQIFSNELNNLVNTLKYYILL